MFQKESRSLGSAPFETQAQMNDNPETALRRTICRPAGAPLSFRGCVPPLPQWATVCRPCGTDVKRLRDGCHWSPHTVRSPSVYSTAATCFRSLLLWRF